MPQTHAHMKTSSASPLRHCSLALLTLGVFGLSAHAEDWARFRGPNGTGVVEAKNMPVTMDAATTTWKVDVGHGWSSPTIFKDKVFVTGETGPGKRAVICLNAANGKELWRHEVTFAEHKKHSFNSFASSTPFVDEQRVYVNWTNGNSVEALALDHTGKQVWRNEHVADYVHEHGYGSSPVIADGVMIVRAEFLMEKEGKPLATEEQRGWKNCITGLDAATGKQVWKLEVPDSLNSFGTPTVRDVKGGHEFILANTSSGFMGLDTKTGKINWQHNPGYKQRSVGSYVLKDDYLFAAFGQGGGGSESALLKLGGSKPEVITIIAKKIPYVPTPLVIGDRLYLLQDGGIMTCLKWPSGEEVYSERLSAEGGRSTKYFSSPVAADGKIYCASQMGDVVVVKAGDKFEILGVSKLDAPINATPAIAWNHLFVRTEKSLWCLGAKTQLP